VFLSSIRSFSFLGFQDNLLVEPNRSPAFWTGLRHVRQGLELDSVLGAITIEFSEVNIHGLYVTAFRAKEEPVVSEVFV
jgi:hypothetical protein